MREVRRTECFNGFWDGVEGGLGGAVWLLVGRRHCGWTSGGVLLKGFSAYAPVLFNVCIDWTMMWYDIRAQSPLAETFPMPTSPDIQCDQVLFFFEVLFLRSSGLTLQYRNRLDNGMVWYPRTVSLSRKVPNADVAGCRTISDSLLLKWQSDVQGGLTIKEYVQNGAVAGPDMYM